MQIRVPESMNLINLELIVKVQPDRKELLIWFYLGCGKCHTWSFETRERFNEVLEQIQSFYKEL